MQGLVHDHVIYFLISKIKVRTWVFCCKFATKNVAQRKEYAATMNLCQGINEELLEVSASEGKSSPF